MVKLEGWGGLEDAHKEITDGGQLQRLMTEVRGHLLTVFADHHRLDKELLHELFFIWLLCILDRFYCHLWRLCQTS